MSVSVVKECMYIYMCVCTVRTSVNEIIVAIGADTSLYIYTCTYSGTRLAATELRLKQNLGADHQLADPETISGAWARVVDMLAGD